MVSHGIHFLFSEGKWRVGGKFTDIPFPPIAGSSMEGLKGDFNYIPCGGSQQSGVRVTRHLLLDWLHVFYGLWAATSARALFVFYIFQSEIDTM